MLVTQPPAQLAPKLWMLGTSQYPLYLVKGDREGIVFEGGVGAMGIVLAEQLDSLAIPRDFVRQVVITHAHPDHVMAVPLLREVFPAAVVAASGVAAKTLGTEKAICFFCKVDSALTEALLRAGAIAERHRPRPLSEMCIAVDRIIREGDTIAAADNSAAFNVLETPGHSDCSLSFHEPNQRILIVSDATGYYLPDRGSWWPNYFTGYGAYLSSMERLAALGAEVLCLSHNAALKGAAEVKAYFAGAIAATRAYHQRIVAETRAGKPAQQLAAELGSEAYHASPLLPLEFFQKNCALLVKQSLQHEGLSSDK